MLVEDDVDVASVVVQMLGELRHEVLHVVTAEAALTFLRGNSHIQLVVSDIMMPGAMNGLRLSQEIHTGISTVPIFLTTGYGGPDVALAEETGIVLLRKPYEIEDLDAAIRKLSLVPVDARV